MDPQAQKKKAKISWLLGYAFLALACPLSVVHALNSTIDLSHKQLVAILKQWCKRQQFIRIERFKETTSGGVARNKYKQDWKQYNRNCHLAFEIFWFPEKWSTIRIQKYDGRRQTRTVEISGPPPTNNYKQESKPFYFRTFFVQNFLDTNFQLS